MGSKNMKTRKEINDVIAANAKMIAQLKNENTELEREGYLLSDGEQWFIEEMEEVKVKEDGRVVKKQWLVGKIHWMEAFKDEDKPNDPPIMIERKQTVRINGNWNW